MLEKIVQVAIQFLDDRFPEKNDVVISVFFTQDDKYLFGVHNEWSTDSTSLCAETWPICTCHLDNQTPKCIITLYRKNIHTSPIIITPCWVCQERLICLSDKIKIIYSPDWKIENSSVLQLLDLQPYHWKKNIPNN